MGGGPGFGDEERRRVCGERLVEVLLDSLHDDEEEISVGV